jgi:hypothetical protein
MSSPLYAPRDVVYIKESAALGFLEPQRIVGAHLGQDGWLYTITTNLNVAGAGVYMDRRSMVNGQILYYSESELVTYCEAMDLAVTKARSVYEALLAKQAVDCPGTD